MFINKKVKDCCGEELDFIVEYIKPKTYYVVEIKYNQQNVIHRCIMATGFADNTKFPKYTELYSRNYEYVIEKELKEIYYFKIISEVKDMEV